MSILVRLPVLFEAFEVSSFFDCDRPDNSLAIPPKWRSLHIAPPVTEVLNHPKRVAVNGQAADTFKIKDIVNRLKLINTVQSVEWLGIKLDNLLGHRRDRLHPLLIKVLHHDNDNVVAPVELDHAV